MSSAGNFKIDVTGPYPCWCQITYKGEPLPSFTHQELSDLEYAVKKAMQEAKLKLGKDSGEV